MGRDIVLPGNSICSYLEYLETECTNTAGYCSVRMSLFRIRAVEIILYFTLAMFALLVGIPVVGILTAWVVHTYRKISE